MGYCMVKPDGARTEVSVVTLVYVTECLWVAVDQREESALHLYHDAMTCKEGV